MLLFSPNITSVYAVDSTTYFARIMQDEVYLYKTPLNVDDVSNIYFSLPKTYFVELVEEESGFYKVNYLNFNGYIKKECVQPIVGAPITPFLENINFRVYSEQSRDLRTEPNTKSGSSSQVAYIPLLNRNLTYYGKIVGESLIDGRTNIWYYCKYSADKDYYGYVYSDFCDELSEIKLNTEEVTYTSSPNFNAQNSTQTPTTLPLKNKTTGIIIAILCLPAGAFVFLIIRNKRIVSENRTPSKEIIDY